jgi:hypothetical protein
MQGDEEAREGMEARRQGGKEARKLRGRENAQRQKARRQVGKGAEKQRGKKANKPGGQEAKMRGMAAGRPLEQALVGMSTTKLSSRVASGNVWQVEQARCRLRQCAW